MGRSPSKRTITPTSALIIFVALIIIAVTSSLLINPCSYDKTRWRLFILSLSGMSIIITFMFYYSLVEIQQEQEQQLLSQSNRLVESNIKDLINSFPKYYKTIPLFIKSLLPLQYGVINVKCDHKLSEIVLSSNIFDIWQQTVASQEWITRDRLRGLTVQYLQWCTSSQLESQWYISGRLNHCNDTMLFGDLLFKYAKCVRSVSYPCQSDYERVTDKIMHTDTYIKLFP